MTLFYSSFLRLEKVSNYGTLDSTQNFGGPIGGPNEIRALDIGDYVKNWPQDMGEARMSKNQ
jgi:hypothetical protein